MRTLLPTLVLALFAMPALASSIEPMASGDGASASIRTIRCDGCPPLAEKPKSDAYFVDAIEPGTQKIEIREENGERRMYRTEAWLGGSPVVFVSKAPPEPLRAAQAEPAAMEPDALPVDKAEAIDTDATTGALDLSTPSRTEAAAALSREFDPSGFELRTE